MLDVGCLLFVVCCPLFGGCRFCLLFGVRCVGACCLRFVSLLFVASCSLFVVRCWFSLFPCVLFAMYCLCLVDLVLIVVWCLLLDGRCVLFAACLLSIV